MGDPINTGPGGFNVDGETYTYDIGVPEAQGGSQGVRHQTIDVSTGFLGTDGKPKDLTQKTKVTLAQYLSNLTNGKEGSTPIANKYPIDSIEKTESITTSDGNPAPLGQIDNTAAFAPVKNDTNVYTDSLVTISQGLKKGKSSARGTDGNDLLPGLPGDSSYVSDLGKQTGATSLTAVPLVGHTDTTKLVKPYVQSVLSSNRFALAGTNLGQKAFGDSDTTSAGFNPSFSKQSRLGTYDPHAPTVTPGRMAAIGPLLTMRAGQELGSSDPGSDPNDGGIQAKALLPGLGQLGVTRIDQQLLLASDVLATLTTDEPPGATILNVVDKSWGQLNNVDDPYSGTDAVGMLVLSTACVAALELAMDALSVILGAITPSLKSSSRDSQGRYSLGEYIRGSKTAKKSASGGIGGSLSALGSLNFGALLGIQPTNYPFNRALTVGMNAFFGIPDSAGGSIGLNQLAGAVSSSVDSPGFNVVVARSIIRSSLTIVDQMKRIGGNPMNAITQILALIDVIRSSKIVAACNVFASLGDQILSNPDAFVDKDANSVKVSEMDNLADIVGGAVGKNRMKGSLKLAWASNTAPANLLLPANVLASSLLTKGMGQFNLLFGVQEDSYSQVKSNITHEADAGRLSTEAALAMESLLAASYVPFYFHDVRTNEMVGFHAFLASLTDDYAASYDKSEGFGRVEPVRIYKGTERRIGMSFYVATTSMLDFDEMWLKINKLTTLVYPQFTRGIQLQDNTGDYKFTQPFSQLVGASPLIRIRLGDLLRSNYSLFALGRMFGMGNSNFTVNKKSLLGTDGIDQGTLDNLAAQLQKARNNPSSETYIPCAGDYQFFDDSGSGVGIGIPPIPGVSAAGSGPKFAPSFNPASGLFLVTAVKVHPDNPTMLVCTVKFNDDPHFTDVYGPMITAADAVYNNDSIVATKYIGGKYIFPVTSLKATEKSTYGVATQLASLSNVLTNNAEYGTAVGDFMNPNNNAVAKSFKDTSGKGLAGFIETMSFDWMDKVTWETSHGRIAPKICKVTIAFAPIHDITPGLDHDGFNRAPLYPVGGMRQGD